ncbi:reverse transcriptase domain-containing protein [Cupriavidus pinatubonensis]|uniref:reverse transcriptase domain-containing protein n=1 Tax=Cupriavidus pinatubonensis TaxID=248026 RepID=UPI00361C94A7
MLLYIERWLKAPVQMPDGAVEYPDKGTPQGGVVSPLLANLFLHYAFDRWMQKHHPDVPFARYADDVICHCKSEAQARLLKQGLETRLAECKLDLHPEKTKIVYCKQANRHASYPLCQFDFLGYTFRPRSVRSQGGKLSVGFVPAVSNKAAKAMRQEMRRRSVLHRYDLSLTELADRTRPTLRGWIQYYGRFYRSALAQVLLAVDAALVRWAQRKYKPLRGRKRRAAAWLRDIKSRQPGLFAHWAVETTVGR